MQPPGFATSRLYLRPVAATDVPTVQRLFADYEIIRHLSREVPWPYPEEGARDFVCKVVLPAQGRDRWVWAICPADSPGRLIGMVDLWRPGRPEHRGFWLARHYWGRGLMSEALVPLTNWAFDGIGYQKLILANARGNLPSRRLKEKAGARLLRTEPGEFVDPSYTEREDGQSLAGFLELSVHSYAEGCTGATPYVESWFVDADVRGQGIGTRLLQVAEDWALSHGYTELASDADLGKALGISVHLSTGFEEVERAVHFRKKVPAGSGD